MNYLDKRKHKPYWAAAVGDDGQCVPARYCAACISIWPCDVAVLRDAIKNILDDHHPPGDPVPGSVSMDGSAALYPSVRIRGEHLIALRDAYERAQLAA